VLYQAPEEVLVCVSVGDASRDDDAGASSFGCEACEQFCKECVGVNIASPGEWETSAVLHGNTGEDRGSFRSAFGFLKLFVQRALARAWWLIFKLCDEAPSRCRV